MYTFAACDNNMPATLQTVLGQLATPQQDSASIPAPLVRVKREDPYKLSKTLFMSQPVPVTLETARETCRRPKVRQTRTMNSLATLVRDTYVIVKSAMPALLG